MSNPVKDHQLLLKLNQLKQEELDEKYLEMALIDRRIQRQRVELAQLLGNNSGLVTPREAVEDTCSIPIRNHYDTYKMTLQGAKHLKEEFPDVDLYFTTSLTATHGRVVVVKPYKSFDCELLLQWVNYLNDAVYKTDIKHQIEPKRVKILNLEHADLQKL